MAEPAFTFFDPTEEGVAPDAARHPWVLDDGGGGSWSTAQDLPRIVATASQYHFTRTHTSALVSDRMEIQAQFAFVSSSPDTFTTSGHILAISDGNRRLGLAMGTTLTLVDPVTGDIIHEIPSDEQPGEAYNVHWVSLVKRGTSRWEVWYAGQRLVVWPYAATTATTGAAWFRWGFADETGDGTATWGIVETAIAAALAPGPKVERWQMSMPLPIQSHWNAKHHALGRATVGLVHSISDAMSTASDPTMGDFTAGTIVVESAEVELGDTFGSDWTIVGDSGQVGLRRERIRFGNSTTVTYARYDVAEPMVLEADASRQWVRSIRTFVCVDRIDTTDSRGRAGPFLFVRDGTKQIGAALVRHRGAAQRWGWILADGNPSDALGVEGDVFADLDPYQEHLVELFVVGQERVLLFVDNALVEDVRYDRFTTVSTTDQDFRIGRDGSSVLRCRVDFAEPRVQVAHADLSSRPAFWHRQKERLVFRSGVDGNARLDIWGRHRTAAFEARGTDRVLSEIRRLSADDDATLTTERRPAGWFLDVTYPTVSPVFIDAVGSVPTTSADFAVSEAPAFTPTQLVATVKRYLLPHSSPESKFFAYGVTTLTSSVSSGGGGSQFTVDSITGFSEGDSLEIRTADSGNVLAATYDSDEGLTNLLSGQVRDFSGNDRTGALTGTDAFINNTAGFSAFLDQDDPSTGDVEGLRTATTYSPTLSAGFTYAGRFTHGAAHSVNWHILKTSSGVGTGGVSVYWAAAGNLLTAVIYSGAGSKTVTYTFNPTANSVTWIGVRWDPATNELSLWRNGTEVATSATTAFTMLDPGATSIGFGCAETGTSNMWLGDHRDHSLYTRTLTDDEMLDLYEATTGRESIRTDADLYISYLPAGWPAILATHADTTAPLAADTMTVACANGSLWANWSVTTVGAGNDEIVGTIDLPGLDSAKLAAVTSGGTVRGVGASASVDVWLEVFGTASVGGAAQVERLHVVGTTPTVGTKLWATVHGIVCTPAAQANVSVVDVTSTNTMYTITTGNRSSGVHLFDPPLLAGPAKVTAVADGATTAVMQVWGVEEALNYTGYNLTLSGTTPVTTVMTVAEDGWDSVRVLAMGYVAAARTVTLSAVFCDPDADVILVSDSSSDTQPVKLVLLSTLEEVVVVEAELDGTTPVTVSLADVFEGGALWHVLGVELGVIAVGNITVTLDSGAPSAVTVCTFAAGERTKGIDRRRIANATDVEVVLNQAQTTARYVGMYGIDADGVTAAVVTTLDGTDPVTLRSDLVEVHGFCVGHVPPTKWVTFTGKAWRYTNAVEALLGVRALHGWSMESSVSSDAVISATLTTLVDTDATLAAVDIPGEWWVSEECELTDYTAGTVTVTTLVETHGTGSVLRKL